MNRFVLVRDLGANSVSRVAGWVWLSVPAEAAPQCPLGAMAEGVSGTGGPLPDGLDDGSVRSRRLLAGGLCLSPQEAPWAPGPPAHPGGVSLVPTGPSLASLSSTLCRLSPVLRGAARGPGTRTPSRTLRGAASRCSRRVVCRGCCSLCCPAPREPASPPAQLQSPFVPKHGHLLLTRDLPT